MSAGCRAPLPLAKPLLSLKPASRTGPEDTLWKTLSPVWLLPPHALLSPGLASPSLCSRSTAPGRASCPSPQPSRTQAAGVTRARSCWLVLRLRSGPGVAVLPRSSLPNVRPHPRVRECARAASAASGRMGWLGSGQSGCPGTSHRMSWLPGERGAGQLGVLWKGLRGRGGWAPGRPGWGRSVAQCGHWRGTVGRWGQQHPGSQVSLHQSWAGW